MDRLAGTDVSSPPARAGVAQLAEHNLPKVGVAGSIPVSRSIFCPPPDILGGMTDGPPTVDPWRYTARFAVRQYELDQNGHVNNAVYLNWAEQVAIDHVEAMGFGRDWSLEHGGGWVVREHHVTSTGRCCYGDVVLVTTLPQRLAGVRGTRRTEIHRESTESW